MTRNAIVQWPLVAVLAGAVIAAGVLQAQRRGSESLRENVDRLRRLENIAPKPEPPPSVAAAEIRAKERALEDLRARIAAAREATISRPPETLPSFGWRQRGTDSPASTLETALYAAATGDTAMLASTLHFTPYVTAKGQLFFNRLDPESRGEFNTAEEMITTLIASQLPGAGIRASRLYGDVDKTDAVLDFDRNGQNRTLSLQLRRTISGWRILVPESIVNLVGRESPRPKS
jgi:hypothetical protein